MVIKDMLPINQESNTRIKLIDELTKIGFLDGRSLTTEELKNTKNQLIFWEDILDVEVAQNKEFYLVFTIGIPKSSFADNVNLETIVPIELDLFTTQAIDSKGMFDLRNKLETELASSSDFINLQLTNKGFEPNFKLNALSYRIERRITY